MLAVDFALSAIVIGGAALILVIVLGYRLLNRDATVQRSRWGFFVERDHYDEPEGEVWTVDPLPPPTPPPPLPPRPDDETQTWPKREDA